MKRDLICIKSILQVKRFKPPDVAQYLTLSTELERFARSLDNDDFVKRNLFALSSAIAGKETEALGKNLVSLLKAANKPNVLNHVRKRRFWGWVKRKVSSAVSWAKRNAQRLARLAREKARRLAAAARRKALWLLKKAKEKALRIWNKVKNWALNTFGGLTGVFRAFRNGLIVLFSKTIA